MGYLRCFRLPRRLRSIMARSFVEWCESTHDIVLGQPRLVTKG